MSILFLLVGLGLILSGANFLTDGAAALAKRFNISSLVIGLTIVAFGTSAPELTVSIVSAINGSAELSIGNVVGSNIFNILMIVGVTAVVAPITITKGTLTKEIPLAILSCVVVLICANDVFLETGTENILNRADGLLMLCFFAIFLGYTFAIAHDNTGEEQAEIRPLSTDIDLLPRCHGSALFTRGQTQSLATVTLGALGEHQILDGLGIEDAKRFMLHYNFPPFSVGETGRYGAPGRREIGHGALGERALSYVIPSEEEFPYTIRVVSEILESNGSSSQATICAGTMALMAAGVPIKKPVAGIAMGLITHEDDYTILTDIQGMEDHLGDMDFKVAGTRDGITALQMDIKIDGINREILKEALAQAKKARFEILDVIEKQIDKPREDVSKYAPKTEVFMINPDKIKDVIGRGGEMITKIILECSNVNTVNDINAVKVDLEDDGRVIIYHTDRDVINRTADRIKDIAREVEIGKTYTCRVVSIQDFGIFVELWPGCEGLIHVSQLDTKRVDKPSDLFKVGDEVIAIATGYDKKGKLNLSRKDLLK